MKKRFSYFIFFVLSIFVFCNYVDAKELQCIYKDPVDGGNFTLVFVDSNPSDYSHYTVKNYMDVETTSNGMYIDPSKSSINKFYVGKHPSSSSNTYYKAPGSMKMSGVSWIFSPSMAGKNFADGSVCPVLRYSSYNQDYTGKTNDYLYILHASDDADCSGYASCKNLELVSNNSSSFLGSCIFPISYKDVSTTLTISSYSDGQVMYKFIDGTAGVVDFDADYPIKYTRRDSHGNIVDTTEIYISKEEFNKIVSINSNNSLTCIKPYVCSENYGQYYKKVFLTTDLSMCPKDAFGNTQYNDVDTSAGGNASAGGTGGGSGTTIPGKVTSTCSEYLGVAGQGDNIATFLDGIFGIMKVGSIVLVIVFGMLDFSKALINDKEKVPQVAKKFATRLALLVLLLLLPTFIDMIGQILGYEDILCGIK